MPGARDPVNGHSTANAADFDPASVAAALQLLEVELQHASDADPEPEATLEQLRNELATLVTRARAWAENQGLALPLPAPPRDGASRTECARCAEALAQALHGLTGAPASSRPQPGGTDKTLRDFIARLRHDDAGAYWELRELVNALCDVLGHLEVLGAAIAELHAGTAALLLSDDPQVEALCRLEERAERARSACAEIVRSFQQICGALVVWTASSRRGT
jgi:hypothetical protein